MDTGLFNTSELILGIPGVGNAARLSPNIIRSAQPVELGYHLLAERLGVEVSYNLDSDAMSQVAKAEGITFVFWPMHPYQRVMPEALDKIVSDIWQRSLGGTVHFNCAQGCDRTGTVAAAIRLKYCGWSLTDAREERDRLGFHQIWSPWLDPTIEDYAEYLRA